MFFLIFLLDKLFSAYMCNMIIDMHRGFYCNAILSTCLPHCVLDIGQLGIGTFSILFQGVVGKCQYILEAYLP